MTRKKSNNTQNQVAVATSTEKRMWTYQQGDTCETKGCGLVRQGPQSDTEVVDSIEKYTHAHTHTIINLLQPSVQEEDMLLSNKAIILLNVTSVGPPMDMIVI